MQAFFDMCHAAGPVGCAFYDSSSKKIKGKLDEVYQALLKKPLPVALLDRAGDAQDNYGLIDYSLVRSGIFSSLYNPWETYYSLAEGLAELYEVIKGRDNNNTKNDPAMQQGDGALLAGQKLFKMLHKPSLGCADACACSSTGDKAYPFLVDGQMAVLCNDGDPVPGDLKSFEEYIEMLSGESEWGEIWGRVRGECM
jgi:hypothetical protein